MCALPTVSMTAPLDYFAVTRALYRSYVIIGF